MTSLTRNGKHSWLLEGELTLEVVPKLLRICPEVDKIESVTIDLSGVTKGDSAGLSLLIEWMALARKKGGVIHYIKLPSDLARLAGVCGLDFLNSGVNKSF